MAARKLFVAMAICFLFYGSHGAITNGRDNYASNAVPRAFDTKSMLTSLATNLMSRGFSNTGGSQVVSLNLTNLLVLVLLKALIFAAGSLGAGSWRGGFGRSNDGQEAVVTEQEILLFLSYLTGEPGNNHCLQLVACNGPQQARRYAAAGEMLLRASKMVISDEDPNYQAVLDDLRQAAGYGLSGGDCSRFSCDGNVN